MGSYLFRIHLEPVFFLLIVIYKFIIYINARISFLGVALDCAIYPIKTKF